MSPEERAYAAAVALWLMAGPPPGRHVLPGHEHSFVTPLQPMTLFLRTGSFKTHDEYSHHDAHNPQEAQQTMLSPFMELYKDRVRNLDREQLEAFALKLAEEHYSLYRSQIAQTPTQADTSMMDLLTAAESN